MNEIKEKAKELLSLLEDLQCDKCPLDSACEFLVECKGVGVCEILNNKRNGEIEE